jgi:5-methyltetrahydropteroyltriglutamate--homocysteine methyltransferase
MAMARSHILGFPRIGEQRELKFAVESFWRGEISENDLTKIGAALRERHWLLQREAGLDFVAAGDFSYYDHMLDTAVLLGALPKRFGFDPALLTRSQYFELARGNALQPAMEMTKWFDTNYHYIVPELSQDTTFEGGVDWWLDEIAHACAQSPRQVKPVLVGPITFLRLAKSHVAGFDPLTLLPAVVKSYQRVIGKLATLGIEWLQLDESALCLDLEPAWLNAYDSAYAALSSHGVKIMIATYFDSASDHASRISALSVSGFHIDTVRAPSQLDQWLKVLPNDSVLSVGCVDGRNIWRCDLGKTLKTLKHAGEQLRDRLWLAPSCSLLHVPISLAGESSFDAEVKPWLAFAHEKLREVAALTKGLNDGAAAIVDDLAASDAAQLARKNSARVNNQVVQQRLSDITADMAERKSAFSTRIEAQKNALNLPTFPTTTIGSFPQTSSIRQTRAAYKRGEMRSETYLEKIRSEIETAVRKQEELGLDVLVHGEAERNDMVEYFGEQLWGYAFSANGWVQSYGSRCVKPPIIFGDVYRAEPMTVETARYAQSLTTRPMKGMLTGPVTMLQWSFVRDDQPRETTALQLALAIRDEVADLEKAGIKVIQIDEPAFREGLPIKQRDWAAYLEWAVRSFKISAAVVKDETQIHTHMCYSEFNDILDAIAAMDADVITIETSRSNMELLEGFGKFKYPNEIGPGVYDIHSPRIPTVDAMTRMLRRAASVIPPARLWVNPDCGLKTRGWPETEAALKNMVQAAHVMRAARAPA